MSEDKPAFVRVLSWPVEDLPALTPAENRVLELARRGLKDADIAKARATSTRTVSHQLQAIYAKLGVSNRWELLAYHPLALSSTPPGPE